jgi:hypothetical protein
MDRRASDCFAQRSQYSEGRSWSDSRRRASLCPWAGRRWAVRHRAFRGHFRSLCQEAPVVRARSGEPRLHGMRNRHGRFSICRRSLSGKGIEAPPPGRCRIPAHGRWIAGASAVEHDAPGIGRRRRYRVGHVCCVTDALRVDIETGRRPARREFWPSDLSRKRGAGRCPSYRRSPLHRMRSFPTW